MDDNEDGESQKFLTNGLMKKRKYEEYHEEYVSMFTSKQINGFGILWLILTIIIHFICIGALNSTQYST